MARWSLASYNRFLGESMSKYKLTRKEAAQHYREMRDHLSKSIFRTDLKKHPRIGKRMAAKAREKVKPPAEIVAAWEAELEQADEFEEEQYGGAVDTPGE